MEVKVYNAKRYLPKSVKILGITIQIKHKNIDDLGLYENETIYLRDSYASKELAYNTLYHEIGHAIAERLGMQLNLNLEEIFVNSFGNVLAENKLYP